jgi:D-alanyl-D-alanine carboxypeptidase
MRWAITASLPTREVIMEQAHTPRTGTDKQQSTPATRAGVRILHRHGVLRAALIGVVLLAFGLCTTATGRPAAPAQRSPSSGLTPEALQALLVEQLPSGFGGMVVHARLDGQEPVVAAAGLADRERGTEMTGGDRFRVYSITKALTAVVVLQLAEEGQLSLDGRLTDYLDDPAVTRLPFVGQITLRQLLGHTSGVYDYADEDSPFLQDAFFGPDADPTKVWAPQELLGYADAARHAPYFAPGTGVHYSNTGYILLGLVVEQVTRESLEAQMHRRIFAPLALRDTTLDDRQAQQAAASYVPGYFLAPHGTAVSLAGTNASWAWAAGGLISSAGDLARFADALFSGALLSPESMTQMFTFRNHGDGTTGFGLGVLRADTPAGRWYFLSGGSGGYATLVARVPEAHLTAIVLQNWWPNNFEVTTVVAGILAFAEGEHR